MRRVLVVLLILGATVGVSPALAAHGKKPSPPGHHPSGVVVDQRAIAIIASRPESCEGGVLSRPLAAVLHPRAVWRGRRTTRLEKPRPAGLFTS